MLDNKQGTVLLRLARSAIGRELGFDSHDYPRTPWLEEPGATFVTLTLNDRLRGCVGSLEAWRPLVEDVRQNAVSAAFRDPRFPPLSEIEFASTVIEVSVLSKPEALRFGSQAEALAQLQRCKDGVILEYGRHRATYLPQVWAQLPDPQSFVDELKVKAGLPEDFWSNDIRLSRYSIQKFSELD